MALLFDKLYNTLYLNRFVLLSDRTVNQNRFMNDDEISVNDKLTK